MDGVRPNRGRFVLRALAVLSALGFLTLVIVQAMAFYAPPPAPPAKSPPHLLGPATKAAPVVRPPPAVRREGSYLYGTKAGYLGPLKISQ